MADIDFKLDERENIVFNVGISGTEQALSNNPPKVRFVCEGKDDVSYSFNGQYVGNDQVEFTIPKMEKKLTEGIYKGHLEVIFEGKYFQPLSMDVEFIQPTKVVAEHVKKKEEMVAPVQKEVQASFVSKKTVKSPAKTKRSSVPKKESVTIATSLADRFKNK